MVHQLIEADHVHVRPRLVEIGLPVAAEPGPQPASLLPGCTSSVNPIDVTGQVFAQPEVLVTALRDAGTCGHYRHVAVFLAGAGAAPGLWPCLQECIAGRRATTGAAPLVLSGVLSAEQRDWLERNGCLVFAEPAQAIDAIADCVQM